MDKWTHTTLFDRPYPPEKRAEGLAISEAIVGGHCDECVFLANCITQRTFKFPATAWCMNDKDWAFIKGFAMGFFPALIATLAILLR